MKNIQLNIIALFLGASCFAQVTIGKTPSEPSNSSVLLEFGTDNKGIVLPTLASAPTSFVPGTFIVNSTANNIQVYEEKTNTWINLTDGITVSNPYTNTGTDTGNGVIIGDANSNKPGVLVLDAVDKALVLPKVANPHTTIGNKAVAGTIVYDTISDSLAIYDGTNWHYWN